MIPRVRNANSGADIIEPLPRQAQPEVLSANKATLAQQKSEASQEEKNLQKAQGKRDRSRFSFRNILTSSKQHPAAPAEKRVLTNQELENLAVAPKFVKEHEQDHINKYRLDIGDAGVSRNENGKIPLSKYLNPDSTYIWVLLKLEGQEHPQIVIGYENTDEGKRYGHPTLLDDLDNRKALIAGELRFLNGKWVIDNNSGRFGTGNVKERKSSHVQKHDLMRLAKNVFNEHTDLDIVQDMRFSEQRWLRLIQTRTGHFMRKSED